MDAIEISSISKEFRVPHEKYSSLKQNAIHLFSKKSYKRFKALDDVSFNVKKGEFFGIVGRNGSGKSTLLKILAGIYQPDKGHVKVNGSLSPFIELGVGFNPELSARDNVFLNGAILGLTRKEIASKFDSIIKFAELENFVDQKLKNFSSGMQVRLAFSISIQAQSDILLIDEVLAVGDTNFQAKCLKVFKEMKASGRTIILVTHDMNIVEQFCDRVALIRNGKLIFVGDTNKAATKYKIENIELDPASKRSIKGTFIKDIGTLNETTEKVNTFGLKQDIVIEMDVVSDGVQEVVASLGIVRKTDNLYVAGINSRNDDDNIILKKGLNRIVCKIPASQLTRNEYTLRGTLFTPDFEMIDQVSDQSIVIITERLLTNDGAFNIKGEWKATSK